MANSCKNISTSFTTVISFGTVRQIFPVVQSEFLTFSNSVVWWIEYQVGRVGIVSRYVEKTALNMILHRWVDNVVLVVCNGYTNILLRVMGKSVTAPQCWPSIPHAFKTISTNVLQFYTRYNSINLHIKCAMLVILCSKADVWLNQIPIAWTTNTLETFAITSVHTSAKPTWLLCFTDGTFAAYTLVTFDIACVHASAILTWFPFLTERTEILLILRCFIVHPSIRVL